MLRERSEQLNQNKQEKIDREVKKALASIDERDNKKKSSSTSIGFHNRSKSVIEMPQVVRTDSPTPSFKASPKRAGDEGRKILAQHKHFWGRDNSKKRVDRGGGGGMGLGIFHKIEHIKVSDLKKKGFKISGSNSLADSMASTFRIQDDDTNLENPYGRMVSSSSNVLIQASNKTNK